MRYLSMFSGIGGFEYGIQCAFNKQFASFKQNGEGGNGDTHQMERDVLPTSWTTPLCIGYSEIDKYAIQIYEKHFNHKNYGDATKIDTGELPDFELLVGGFPCQAFSIAGKRKGFDDTRGTLFFEIARILADKRPKYLVLENVKGLLSHEGGETFQTIIGVLTDLGYFVEWQVLNSKNHGVPQNRERVFIIGYLGGECRPEVFPIGESSDGIVQGEEFREQISNTLRTNYSNGHSNETYVGELREITKGQSQGARVYDTEGVSQTISSGGGGMGAKTGLYAMRGRGNGQQLEYRGDETNSLTSVQKDNLWVKDARIRRLTPTECERLQGFPDGWTEGISDTQRYKCLGNAVTTNVITDIFVRFFKSVAL